MDMQAYYEQLKGFAITGFHFAEDEFGMEPFPVFTLTKPGHAPVQISVSRDEEGNGGGFLFIENA